MIDAAFILCAGSGRYLNGTIVQLLEIDGECVVDRMVRQCRERGVEPFVVTGNPAFEDRGYKLLWPSDESCTLNTFLSTRDHWGDDRVVTMYGDVIFSKAGMDQMFCEDLPVRVYGNQWEYFSMGFAKSHEDEFVDAIHKAIAFTSDNLNQGKFRKVYQAYCGLQMIGNDAEERALNYYLRESGMPVHYPYDTVFYYINDWTQDIDDQKDYDNFIRQRLWQMDDRPETDGDG